MVSGTDGREGGVRWKSGGTWNSRILKFSRAIAFVLCLLLLYLRTHTRPRHISRCRSSTRQNGKNRTEKRPDTTTPPPTLAFWPKRRHRHKEERRSAAQPPPPRWRRNLTRSPAAAAPRSADCRFPPAVFSARSPLTGCCRCRRARGRRSRRRQPPGRRGLLSRRWRGRAGAVGYRRRRRGAGSPWRGGEGRTRQGALPGPRSGSDIRCPARISRRSSG